MWCKVRLTKQRFVDLATDGLWAMPLNTGWVPVKARRLQDWGKLKKYIPIHKQGDVCSNGSLPKGDAPGQDPIPIPPAPSTDPKMVVRNIGFCQPTFDPEVGSGSKSFFVFFIHF